MSHHVSNWSSGEALGVSTTIESPQFALYIFPDLQIFIRLISSLSTNGRLV